MRLKRTRLLSKRFIKWLSDAGIVPELTYRVVIDARYDGVVSVTAYMSMDAAAIKGEPPDELREAEVTSVN